ncbi:hypothetical protein [Sulfurovum riftiae]|nr:hypothetical protein [Sulfurovum riftiae]
MIDEYYDEAMDMLDRLCNNDEEVAVSEKCLDHIKEEKYRYEHAISVAPSHTDRQRKLWDDALSQAGSEQERKDIMTEYRDILPLYSEVIQIKQEIWEWCELYLIDAGIGKRRRIERFRPVIYKILASGRDLRSREERVNENAMIQLLMNKLDW